MTDNKKCSSCEKTLSINCFQVIKTLKTGKKVLRNVCRTCRQQRQSAFNDTSERKQAAIKLAGVKQNEKEKQERKEPQHRAKYVYRDSRATDKKRGLNNNLTIEWVQSEFKKGCNYCLRAENECKMSLDRLDNSIGHIMSNVVPCCNFCNYLKRDMPYEAWKFLTPHIKAAIELNLFKDWMPDVHTKIGG